MKTEAPTDLGYVWGFTTEGEVYCVLNDQVIFAMREGAIEGFPLDALRDLIQKAYMLDFAWRIKRLEQYGKYGKSSAKNVEEAKCSKCGRDILWVGGILTPPPGVRVEKLCRVCKEK